MGSVTVSTKGQVVLPAAIRRRMKIRPGTRLRLELSADGQAVILRAPAGEKTSRVEDGFGLLKARRHVSIEDMDGARILANLRSRGSRSSPLIRTSLRASTSRTKRTQSRSGSGQSLVPCSVRSGGSSCP